MWDEWPTSQHRSVGLGALLQIDPQRPKHVVLARKNAMKDLTCRNEVSFGRHRIFIHQQSSRVELTICLDELIVGQFCPEIIDQIKYIVSFKPASCKIKT